MTFNVACIGAGWATRNRHLPALRRDPRVRLVAVVDRHIDRARATAKAFDIPIAAASLDGEWTQEVQCLTVGTPPWEHAGCVQAAVERGWHCLCEKPFVLPPQRAAELTAAARERGTVLATVHNFQFSNGGRRLFEFVESGRLGKLEAVYGFQLSNPRRGLLPSWHRDLSGGLFLDEVSHLLYLIRRVLGRLEPRQVDARLDGNEIRDISVTFEADSIWASLVMGFNASLSEWDFAVVGSEGVVLLDVFRDLVVLLPNDGRHGARDVLRSSRGLVAGHVLGFARSGLNMLRHRLSYGNDEVVSRFLDAVGGDRERIRWMSAKDGCDVVSCIERLLEGAGLSLEPPPS